jgi:hypothetical protein
MFKAVNRRLMRISGGNSARRFRSISVLVQKRGCLLQGLTAFRQKPAGDLPDMGHDWPDIQGDVNTVSPGAGGKARAIVAQPLTKSRVAQQTFRKQSFKPIQVDWAPQQHYADNDHPVGGLIQPQPRCVHGLHFFGARHCLCPAGII